MLAIQGTRAAEVLQTLTDYDLSQMKWRDCTMAKVAGARGLIARGGYTGCDGFEFMFFADDAPGVWRALLAAGAVPCGLGARDVLRLEAGLPLYGHELREEWTPYESGCGFAVKLAKGDFLGRAALEEKQTPTRRIRALKMSGKAIPREGYAVLQNGAPIGEITSGTMSPALGIGIALAMVRVLWKPGDIVEVQVRNALHPAQIVGPAVCAARTKMNWDGGMNEDGQRGSIEYSISPSSHPVHPVNKWSNMNYPEDLQYAR
jgi:aminomethyltransferase